MGLSGLSGLSALSGIGMSAASVPPPSAPVHNTTNLWVNLRADTGVTANANAVSSWTKVAGSGSPTFSSQSATLPVYVSSDAKLNNKPSIHFGTNDQVLGVNVVATINTASWSTTFVVYHNTAADVGVIVGWMRPGGTPRFQIEVTASGKAGTDVFDGSSFQTNTEATSFTANTAYVYTLVAYGTGWNLRRNGASILSVTNTHGLDNIETGGGGIIYGIGGSFNSVGSPTITEETEFNMAELVHYTAVNNTNIAVVENALASWYGITF